MYIKDILLVLNKLTFKPCLESVTGNLFTDKRFTLFYWVDQLQDV